MFELIVIAVLGAAVGLIAWRAIPFRTSLPIYLVAGAVGAVLAWLAFRFALAITGWLIWILVALAGAMILIGIVQRLLPSRR